MPGFLISIFGYFFLSDESKWRLVIYISTYFQDIQCDLKAIKLLKIFLDLQKFLKNSTRLSKVTMHDNNQDGIYNMSNLIVSIFKLILI